MHRKDHLDPETVVGRGRHSLGATALVTLFLMAGGCTGATGPDPDPDTSLVHGTLEMTLKVGQESAVSGSVVRILFAQVLEDSRCPVGATCVWEGNAAVELGIRAGMGPTHPLRLNTTLEPRSTVWNGIEVTLLEVTPMPRLDTPTDKDAYGVRLRISPKK